MPPVHVPLALDVQSQAAHARGRVELLRDRDERDTVSAKQVDDLGEICQGPGQAVDLVDHPHINATVLDVRQHVLERARAESSCPFRLLYSWSKPSSVDLRV